ncbi:MAG: TIM44-like domain-containing protein, partial [Geobacter sp.]
MQRQVARVFTVLAAVLFLSITVFELHAEARGGGRRSIGSRGSRTYSKPAAPTYQSSQQRQQATATPGSLQQQPAAGGSFMRSMAGGLMGGMLGSMLFSSFAGASGGMPGSGGIGLFEIALLAGIAYLIYRFMKKRREQNQLAPALHSSAPFGARQPEAIRMQPVEAAYLPADSGLQHIQQMDRSFDETAFQDMVMDYFFRIQAAWMHRDLSSVSGLLTEEMRTIMQGDIDQLLKDKQINRLENIAVRKVEIAEAWQESGQ